MKMPVKLSCALAFPFLVSSAFAAISITDPSVAYTQNFDAFANSSNGGVAFANDSTIPGFYTFMSGNSGTTPVTPGAMDVIYRSSTTVTNGTGSSRIPNGASYPFYFQRPNNSASDIRFGTYGTDTTAAGVGTGYVAYGFALTNNTGAVQTSFSLNYTPYSGTGDLNSGNANSDTVGVSYAINATGIADAEGAYTDVPGMGYSVANLGGVITYPSVTSVNGITLNPGDTIWVRFKDFNAPATDRFSQIDNLSITVPEPAALALVGLAGVGLIARRRGR